MRITGGRARGIPLQTGRAKGVRPATDKMRERVFSSLGDLVPGASVLDLFAGTGAYGLEALSRGAREVLFVEQQADAIAAIRLNTAAVLRSLGHPADQTASFARRDALRFTSEQRFDLIFADPPYPLLREQLGPILTLAAGLLSVSPPGRLILEKPGDLVLPTSPLTSLRELGKSGPNDPSAAILTLP